MRIVYEESGFPRELTEPREWARAIASGSLRPETFVTLTRDGAPATVSPAGEVAELAALFAPVPDDEPGEAVPVVAQSAPVEAAETAPPARRRPYVAPPSSEAPPGPMRATTREPESSSDLAKWILGTIAAVLFLMLIVTNLSSEGGGAIAADNGTATEEPVLNETAAEPGEAVAEGAAIEWTDAGTPKTYLAAGLELTLTAEKDGDGASVPVLTVRSPDRGDSRIVGVPGGETARATFMVLTPRRNDPGPSVLLMTYSMGAHCCTSFRLLTPKGDGWTLADLGSRDGEPLSSAPTDLDGDGSLDFVMRDDAFLYSFASYADSWTPSVVYNVIDGRFVDRSTNPRLRSVHLSDMARSRVECEAHHNGACAAFVGSAARLGQAAAALRFAAANFDAGATEGWLPTRCLAHTPDGSCPAESEQQPSGFVEALDWFLQDHGYVAAPISPPAFETLSEPDPEPTPEPAAPETDGSPPAEG